MITPLMVSIFGAAFCFGSALLPGASDTNRGLRVVMGIVCTICAVVMSGGH